MNIIKNISPIHLLLVDDNEHDRIAFRRSLEKAKIAYNIIEFFHAEEALDYIHCNPYSIDLLVSDQKLPGMSGLELCHQILREGIEMPLIIITGAGTEHLAVKALKAGVNDYIIKDSAGRYLQLLPLVLLDVAKKHREYLLRRRTEDRNILIEDILNKSPIGIAVHSIEKGNIEYLNTTFKEIFDLGESNPDTLRDIFKKTLFTDQHAEEMQRILLSPAEYLPSLPKHWPEVQLSSNRKKKKIINISCIPLADNNLMLCSIQDTTEIKLLHNRVIHSERLAATGQLAASIAHAINSPLQAITLMLSELSAKHDREKELSESILLLREAYNNIKHTVNRLLDLNRPGREKEQLIDINAIIEETAALLQSQLRKNKVEVKLQLSSSLPPILGSHQELAQVFLNLINNAIEAISGFSKLEPRYRFRMNTSGEIIIKSRISKNQVIITIKDNGPGISAQDLDNIFDPFYTSKKKMGIGIGLAACYTIIEDHGGRITAGNLSEGGALFTIKLPLDKNLSTGVGNDE